MCESGHSVMRICDRLSYSMFVSRYLITIIIITDYLILCFPPGIRLSFRVSVFASACVRRGAEHYSPHCFAMDRWLNLTRFFVANRISTLPSHYYFWI